MALPYLPSGSDELPAKRFVLFADTSNRVQKVDESLTKGDGVVFEGIWVSPSLNREDPSSLWTLKEVHLWYTANSDTSVVVEASPDGGSTWIGSKTASLSGGTVEVHSIALGFNITGDDLRIRIRFTKEVVVNILVYRSIIQRGGGIRYNV